MVTKTIKLKRSELNKIINECVTDFICDKKDNNLYENYMNNMKKLGEMEPQFNDGLLPDDNGFINFNDDGDDHEDEFAHQLMDLCIEGSSLFDNIAETIRTNDYKSVKKYNLEKVLVKVEKICELINEIWNDND